MSTNVIYIIFSWFKKQTEKKKPVDLITFCWFPFKSINIVMLSKYWHSNNHCLKFNWLDSKWVIELFSSIWALSNIWLKVLSVDSNVKHKCMATLHPVCVRSPLRVMIWKSTDEDEEATNLSNTVSFFSQLSAKVFSRMTN